MLKSSLGKITHFKVYFNRIMIALEANFIIKVDFKVGFKENSQYKVILNFYIILYKKNDDQVSTIKVFPLV